MFQVEQDDPKITEMDPIRKIWMYENWLADQNDKAELAKNVAYLLASFWNPEAVKQILGEGNIHASSDEEFEESSNMIKQINEQNDKILNKNVKRKKRRVLQG